MSFFDAITGDIENACLHDAIEFLELYVLYGRFNSEVLRKAKVVSAYAGGFVKKIYLVKMVDLTLRIARRPASRIKILSVKEARRMLFILRSVSVY